MPWFRGLEQVGDIFPQWDSCAGTPETKHLLPHFSTAQSTAPQNRDCDWPVAKQSCQTGAFLMLPGYSSGPRSHNQGHWDGAHINQGPSTSSPEVTWSKWCLRPKCLSINPSQALMLYAFNLSMKEAEAREWRVQGQPKLIGRS